MTVSSKINKNNEYLGFVLSTSGLLPVFFLMQSTMPSFTFKEAYWLFSKYLDLTLVLIENVSADVSHSCQG